MLFQQQPKREVADLTCLLQVSSPGAAVHLSVSCWRSGIPTGALCLMHPSSLTPRPPSGKCCPQVTPQGHSPFSSPSTVWANMKQYIPSRAFYSWKYVYCGRLVCVFYYFLWLVKLQCLQAIVKYHHHRWEMLGKSAPWLPNFVFYNDLSII